MDGSPLDKRRAVQHYRSSNTYQHIRGREMVSRKWPTGISPSAKGIRIRIFRKGREIYSETIKGDARKKADLASAVKYRSKLLSRIDLGLPVGSDKGNAQDFSSVAQDYLDTLESKYSTNLSYEGILNKYWMPAFASWPIDEVNTSSIKKILSGSPISQKTKRNILIPLRGVLDFAEITPNPAAGIRLKRQQKKEIDRYSLDERTALMSALDGQIAVYFAILFGCGLRPAEALGLTWNDYDGEELNISKQITRRRLEDSTKTCVRRRVYVPKWTREYLNNHSTRFNKTWIFLNSKNRCYLDTDTFNEAWQKAHKKLGIKYRIPYTCRHTRASELLTIGIQPADAAQQLGHSVEMFLRTYARWIEDFSTNKDKNRFEVGNGQETGRKNKDDGK